MGYCTDEEILAAVERRVFVDLDPGFGQMWRRLGLADLFSGHDAFVTVGTRVGSAGCRVPTCGLPWIRTLPPVVLEAWPRVEEPGDAITTIATWRGDSGPIEYEGRTYGLRVHSFRDLLPLPGRSDQEFRVALDIHPLETSDLARLAEEGWAVEDPLLVAADPAAYRDFIAGSRAELMVAKALYTDTRSGWISDRSACYLASGRPVVASDTGFGATIPVGEGMLPFASLDEAAAGIDRVASDWKRHAAAARELAEEWFDSDRVLGRLIDEVASARSPARIGELRDARDPMAVDATAVDPAAVDPMAVA
jgi:glycosyltransferase involved in cell wall biosynthesis